MRFKDVFSIIGPSMIGPSSSHTAGAVRIGRVARQLLGVLPKAADISLFGSFADTYQGHGTDLALIGGLFDWKTDDSRIVYALELAGKAGMRVSLKPGIGAPPHPNTAVVRLECGDREVELTGCSIGGGNIEIVKVNGFDVKLTGAYPALVMRHSDRPGLLADATGVLSQAGMNIGHMAVDRKARSGEAMTVMETDQPASAEVRLALAKIADMTEVTIIDVTG